MPQIDFVFGEYDGHVGFCCPHLHLRLGPGYYVASLNESLCGGGKYKLIACASCKSDPNVPFQLAATIRKNKAEMDKAIAGAVADGEVTAKSKQVFSKNGMHIEPLVGGVQ